MSTLLGRIVSAKKEELDRIKSEKPLEAVRDAAAAAPPPRGFAKAVSSRAGSGVIAELKKASPTRGLLLADFSVERLARAYTENGAAALSVLTEKTYFQGDLSNIAAARAVCPLPALRKDFMFDPYQIIEARAAGADAVLLIAASLDRPKLAELLGLAHEYGMDALVEIHSESELEMISGLPCDIIGVNNRNLKDGTVDIGTSLALAGGLAGAHCKISESGIKNRSYIERLRDAGYDGFLIGEALVGSPDPGAALLEFTGRNPDGR
jgi:indole-3-glycerol phosphate synthase